MNGMRMHSVLPITSALVSSLGSVAVFAESVAASLHLMDTQCSGPSSNAVSVPPQTAPVSMA